MNPSATSRFTTGGCVGSVILPSILLLPVSPRYGLVQDKVRMVSGSPVAGPQMTITANPGFVIRLGFENIRFSTSCGF